METSRPTQPYPAELRDRAVRLVREREVEHGSQWAAIRSIAEKVGCNAETLRLWVRRSERDRGARPGLTTDVRDRRKALERERRARRSRAGATTATGVRPFSWTRSRGGFDRGAGVAVLELCGAEIPQG